MNAKQHEDAANAAWARSDRAWKRGDARAAERAKDNAMHHEAQAKMKREREHRDATRGALA